MNESNGLRVETQGAVRVLTLSRPEKRNSIDVALHIALREELAAANREDAVRVVVLCGAGDNFCAGADVNVFIGANVAADTREFLFLHEHFRGFDKPLIAAVHGKVVGMGVTLLPWCDLVYAAENATFLTPFAKLGLVLEYGSSFSLPRLIGRQRTSELVLRGRPIDAATACDWGLVTRVFPTDTVFNEAMQAAQEISAHPPGAVAACKRLIGQGEQSDLASASDREAEEVIRRLGGEENLAAVHAFLSRTK